MWNTVICGSRCAGRSGYRPMLQGFLVWLFLLVVAPAGAQSSRDYIRQQIEEWGSCRNVAITMSGGDLALNKNNAYAYSRIPKSLATAIDELHEAGTYIDDVQLTEEGNWLVLHGDNGFRWNNIPASLEAQLRDLNERNEVITSVTFNDHDGWIIVSKNYIVASSSKVYDWIQEGIESYGKLWAAHMTNDGLALCYENGYKFMGTVPENLKRKLKETKLNVYRLKFLSDGTYFIADVEGNYAYYM